MPFPSPPTHAWWKEAVVYQIYPASFLDSDNDGLGDLPGIISKLDYIQGLGADAIWLSPIFKSPQNDMGYDVSDYRDIHEPYGTLQDAEKLISGCHDRNIKVLLDLVVNHTSDQHAWFLESRQSKTSPKRDWYFWRDPKTDAAGNRQPPNNWSSIFGGSAWTWDEQTGQYYLSLFLPSQPDLNWANDEMRQATYSDMKFWLDRGADGFRIDSMNLMSKHPELPDAAITNAESVYQSGHEYFASGPRMHEYLNEMRKEVFDHYDCMTVGELGFTKDEESVSEYVARDRHELNMVFTGDIVDMDFGETEKYQPSKFQLSTLKEITSKWQKAMMRFDGWNAIYMDNHDSGRSLTRYASDLPQFRKRAAKMLATYLGSLCGTLFMLQGQEIGMANVPTSWGIDDYVDVEGKNHYNRVLEKRGKGADMSDVVQQLRLKARDNGRLPMQWNDMRNAGFSQTGTPWMKTNDDYKEWNVESQVNDPDSVLSYWKAILALRKKEKDVFVYGKYEMLEGPDVPEDAFVYMMESFGGEKKAVILLNFSDESQKIKGDQFSGWRRLIGDNSVVKIDEGTGVELAPYEGVIYCNWE